jgi:hypothetical protein
MRFSEEFYETATGQCPIRKNSHGEKTRLVGEASAMKRKTNFDQYLAGTILFKSDSTHELHEPEKLT